MMDGQKDYKDAILQVVGTVLFSILICALIYYLINPDWVGNVSNFLQIAGTVFAIIAWNNTRILIKKRKRARVEVSSGDIILIVELAKGNIEGDVKKYFESSNDISKGLGEITIQDSDTDILSDPNNKYMALVKPNDYSGALCIRKIQDMPTDESSSNAFDVYISEFRNCIKRFSQIVDDNPISKIHVFISAPGEMSAFIMPYFVNKKDVIMYRHIKSGSYVPLGPVEER